MKKQPNTSENWSKLNRDKKLKYEVQYDHRNSKKIGGGGEVVRERLGRIEHHGDLSISLRSAVSLFDFDFCRWELSEIGGCWCWWGYLYGSTLARERVCVTVYLVNRVWILPFVIKSFKIKSKRYITNLPLKIDKQPQLAPFLKKIRLK